VSPRDDRPSLEDLSFFNEGLDEKLERLSSEGVSVGEVVRTIRDTSFPPESMKRFI
jgi:hypothetical protein